MPPRKKNKAAPSTPIADDDAMAIDTPPSKVPGRREPKESKYDILKDPWTDEQETSLFKGIMKWKPNG
jgi:MRG-binding protein